MKRPLDLSNETDPDLQQPPTKKPRIDDGNNFSDKQPLFPRRDVPSFSAHIINIDTKSRTYHKPEKIRVLPLKDHNSKLHS